MSDDLEKKMIEQAIVALWPKVQEGDPKAIDRMLRLFDRKANAAKPKRRYRMSPKALRQRRAAALKTGEHAGTSSAPMVSKAREVETTKQSGLAVAVDAEFVAIFEQAMNDDPAALRQLTAGQLAALAQVLHGELGQLQEEGLAQQIPMLGGDGEPLLDEDGEVVLRTIPNPRSDAVLRLAKLLGVSVEDQCLTPKSKSDSKLADAAADVRQFMLESYRRTEAARKK